VRKHKNIRLRKSPIVEDRVYLINQIIKESINESFERIIKTDYEIIKESDDILIYRFKTNSGNSYDLEFIKGFISPETVFDSGNILIDYTKNEHVMETIDLAFVPSEVNLEDRDNQELYTKETNRGEQFELMSRISYLTKEFMVNNPNVIIYIIGKDTKESKLNMYLKVFDSIFSSNYIKEEGKASGYSGGAYYFIKNINKK